MATTTTSNHHGQEQVAGGGDEWMPFPTELIGFLIGKGGGNIRRIQETTLCHIDVNRHGARVFGEKSFTGVRIKGPHAGVDRVKRIMMSIALANAQHVPWVGSEHEQGTTPTTNQ